MERNSRSVRRGRGWPLLVFGLIGLNVCIVGATVIAAVSDPSAATEPNYYEQAVNFEEMIRQREINGQLGWKMTPVLRAAVAGQLELEVALTDAKGAPIDGASVSAVAFSSLRSSQRARVTLAPAVSRPGVYTSPARIDRSGLWEFRMRAIAHGQTFTRNVELLVPEPVKSDPTLSSAR